MAADRKETLPVSASTTFEQLREMLSKRLGNVAVLGPDLNKLLVAEPAGSELRDCRYEVEVVPGARLQLETKQILRETWHLTRFTLDGSRLHGSDKVQDICANGEEVQAVFIAPRGYGCSADDLAQPKRHCQRSAFAADLLHSGRQLDTREDEPQQRRKRPLTVQSEARNAQEASEARGERDPGGSVHAREPLPRRMRQSRASAESRVVSDPLYRKGAKSFHESAHIDEALPHARRSRLLAGKDRESEYQAETRAEPGVRSSNPSPLGKLQRRILSSSTCSDQEHALESDQGSKLNARKILEDMGAVIDLPPDDGELPEFKTSSMNAADRPEPAQLLHSNDTPEPETAEGQEESHVSLSSSAPTSTQQQDTNESVPPFADSKGDLLIGIGVEPSKRQMLRAELIDQLTLKDLFGANATSAFSLAQQDAQEREEAVKNRIRKMLELAFHLNTGEAESSQALRNAQKLMRTHNLQQNDVLYSGTTDSAKGGLYGVKLTPVNMQHKMKRAHEYWVLALTKAIELSFDVGSFNKKHAEHNANYVVFFGRRSGAELAAFAYTCAFNRIDWMAGKRALPSDETFPRGHEHAGKRFSDVLRLNPGYADWAKGQEHAKGGAGDDLARFVDYARAQEDATEWDKAYKEGLARALKKQAEATLNAEENHAGSTALAVSSKAVKDQVLQSLGCSQKLKQTRTVTSSHGLRGSRRRGSADASLVDLHQQQLASDNSLALQD